MKIYIKENIAPTLYHCTSVNRTVIGAKKIEFVLDKIIEISFETIEEGYKIYTINLLGHQLSGTSLIHEWASDMEELQSRLVLKTDPTGAIMSVLNRHEIYLKWHNDMEDLMRKKYKKKGGKGTQLMIDQTTKLLQDEQAFLHSLQGLNLFHIFFQGIYNKELKLSNRKYTSKGHFGKQDLPLVLNTICTEHKKETTHRITLDTIGALDKDAFNQEAFTKHIKGMIGVLDVNATLHVAMEEHYAFNHRGWITEADVYLKTHAANMYALANAHTVQQIDAKTADRMVQEFTQTPRTVSPS